MARPKKFHDKRVTTAVRLPEDLRDRLHTAADERDVSVNLLVTRAVTDYLERLRPVDELLEPNQVA